MIFMAHLSGVIAASILILSFGFVLADSLISILIGVIIIIGAYRLVGRSISILLESVPEHVDIDDVKEALIKIEGVEDAHSIHVWTLTSGLYAANVHIVVRDQPVSACTPLLKEINDLLKKEFQISHTTIQFDYPGCDVSDRH